MARRISLLIVIGLVSIILLTIIYLALNVNENARVAVPFTTSPIEVRFRTGAVWGEWQLLSPQDESSGEKGAVSDLAEVRLRTGLGGLVLSVSGDKDQKISTEGEVIRIKGNGKAQVLVIGYKGESTSYIYRGSVVLTK